MGENGKLPQAYAVETLKDSEALYDEWALSYDAELEANGYLTPQRCADVLCAFQPDRARPVIDLGCGTGAGGRSLRLAGFETVDGADYSQGMLQVAQGRQIYRALGRCDLNQPLAAQLSAEAGFEAPYASAVAVGVLNPAHTTPDTLGLILEILRPGGVFVFSLNDHALETGAYQPKLAELAASGAVEALFESYGDHIPKIGLKARVYGVRKTA